MELLNKLPTVISCSIGNLGHIDLEVEGKVKRLPAAEEVVFLGRMSETTLYVVTGQVIENTYVPGGASGASGPGHTRLGFRGTCITVC